ncbi:MAG: phage major capsid protein [Sulfuricurvum sp.]|nr:phage major capsid protein [Sulfuricurvum sp.]
MNLAQLRAFLAELDGKMRSMLATNPNGLSEAQAKEYDDLDKSFDETQVQITAAVSRAEKAEKRELYLGSEQRAPLVGGNPAGSQASNGNNGVDYRSAFWKAQTKQSLSSDEVRSLNTATDAKGGYLVPETFAATIITKATELSYMRDLATVTTSSSVENIPVEGDDGANGWIDEEGTYPESDPTMGTVQLSAWKTGRIIKVTDEALQDTIPGIEGYVALKFTKSTVKAEEVAFVTGDGVKKPTGVLITADVGVTAASATGIAADEIINLMTSLDAAYDPNAYLMMNKNTRAAIRKLKDSTGQYLWVQGFSGNPDTFDGKPIRINKHMPDIAATTKPIAYGDFSYYHIKDRTVMTMKRLDEKYAETGHVGFRIDKRVDGKLVLAEAVKTLQMHV